MEIHSESANLEGKFGFWVPGSNKNFCLFFSSSSSPRVLGPSGVGAPKFLIEFQRLPSFVLKV